MFGRTKLKKQIEELMTEVQELKNKNKQLFTDCEALGREVAGLRAMVKGLSARVDNLSNPAIDSEIPVTNVGQTKATVSAKSTKAETKKKSNKR